MEEGLRVQGSLPCSSRTFQRFRIYAFLLCVPLWQYFRGVFLVSLCQQTEQCTELCQNVAGVLIAVCLSACQVVNVRDGF